MGQRRDHLLCALVSQAATSGSISGTVKDPSGAVLPGVALTLKNTSLGTPYKTTSDANGYYSFPNLSSRRIRLDARLAGFQDHAEVRHRRRYGQRPPNQRLHGIGRAVPVRRRQFDRRRRASSGRNRRDASRRGRFRHADDRAAAQRPQLYRPPRDSTRR